MSLANMIIHITIEEQNKNQDKVEKAKELLKANLVRQTQK